MHPSSPPTCFAKKLCTTVVLTRLSSLLAAHTIFLSAAFPVLGAAFRRTTTRTVQVSSTSVCFSASHHPPCRVPWGPWEGDCTIALADHCSASLITAVISSTSSLSVIPTSSVAIIRANLVRKVGSGVVDCLSMRPNPAPPRNLFSAGD